MTTTPDQIRNDIERTREGLSDGVNQLADAVDPREIAHRQTEKVKDAVVGVKERVMGSDTEVGLVGAAARTPAKAGGWARQQTQGNPWAAGLIAVGVGWMIGSMLPATRPERDAADRVAEKAKAGVADAAGEMAEHLGQPVTDAVDAVKDSAKQAASSVQESAGGSLGGDDEQHRTGSQEPMPGG